MKDSNQKNNSYKEFERLNRLGDRVFWGFIVFLVISIAATIYVVST